MQQVCEEALRKLGWQGDTLLAAGRTDTGVHASGQVIAFDLSWEHPLESLRDALNSHLPADVAARSVKEAPDDFHPRYAAKRRQYRYQIYCQPVRNPLLDRYAWQVWSQPDVERLQEAASILCGTHDFAAFGTPPRSKGSTVRTVYEASWQQQEHRVHLVRMDFTVTANAFLYRMVRRMVFAQVAVGQGRLSLEELQASLENQQECKIQGLAPPQGLCLVNVEYPQEPGRE